MTESLDRSLILLIADVIPVGILGLTPEKVIENIVNVHSQTEDLAESYLDVYLYLVEQGVPYAKLASQMSSKEINTSYDLSVSMTGLFGEVEQETKTFMKRFLTDIVSASSEPESIRDSPITARVWNGVKSINKIISIICVLLMLWTGFEVYTLVAAHQQHSLAFNNDVVVSERLEVLKTQFQRVSPYVDMVNTAQDAITLSLLPKEEETKGLIGGLINVFSRVQHWVPPLSSKVVVPSSSSLPFDSQELAVRKYSIEEAFAGQNPGFNLKRVIADAATVDIDEDLNDLVPTRPVETSYTYSDGSKALVQIPVYIGGGTHDFEEIFALIADLDMRDALKATSAKLGLRAEHLTKTNLQFANNFVRLAARHSQDLSLPEILGVSAGQMYRVSYTENHTSFLEYTKTVSESIVANTYGISGSEVSNLVHAHATNELRNKTALIFNKLTTLFLALKIRRMATFSKTSWSITALTSFLWVVTGVTNFTFGAFIRNELKSGSLEVLASVVAVILNSGLIQQTAKGTFKLIKSGERQRPPALIRSNTRTRSPIRSRTGT
jgi:hypothetical protein